MRSLDSGHEGIPAARPLCTAPNGPRGVQPPRAALSLGKRVEAAAVGSGSGNFPRRPTCGSAASTLGCVK